VAAGEGHPATRRHISFYMHTAHRRQFLSTYFVYSSYSVHSHSIFLWSRTGQDAVAAGGGHPVTHRHLSFYMHTAHRRYFGFTYSVSLRVCIHTPNFSGRAQVKMQWRQAEGIPQLIAVSPLTRALQTVELGFPNRSSDGAPRPRVVSTSLARERVADHQCDRRRALSVHIYQKIFLRLYIYIYIHIYICVCVCVYRI